MPKPDFKYTKKQAYRKAFNLIIVCEGENRERNYFRFFLDKSSSVNLIVAEDFEGSAPRKLISTAVKTIKDKGLKSGQYQLWFVIDTDKWNEQIHELRNECKRNADWFVAQSNPCFEVWLYYHAFSSLPQIESINQCAAWKPLVNNKIQGGFNSDTHPAAIENAMQYARGLYTETGYWPNAGNTQVWMLAEQLLLLIKEDLDMIKHLFPMPVAVE